MRYRFGLALFAVIGLIGFGYPMLNEDTGNLCGALESRLISLAEMRDADQSSKIILLSLQSSLSNGSVIRVALKQQHPDVPVSLACGITYWRLMFNPDSIKRELNADSRREIPQIEGVAPVDGTPDRAREAQKAMRALSSPIDQR
jgi:hypothetical protein